MAATLDPATAPPLDLDRLRADFPILAREVNGHRLVYLNLAATSQKPIQVLDAIDHYYQTSNANAHRSVHRLAAEATELFEQARTRVAAFIDADPRGVVFLRNTTEALNLVAASHARELLQPGDRVVLTVMEHHSNLVPWQLAAQRAGLRLAFIGVTDEGRLDLSDLDELLSPPTRLLSVTQQSNVLGTINDVAALAAEAHRRVFWSASTRPRRCPACGSRCASWTSTSTPSPGTRCAVRWASACSGPGPSCWSGCRPSWVAAR